MKAPIFLYNRLITYDNEPLLNSLNYSLNVVRCLPQSQFQKIVIIRQLKLLLIGQQRIYMNFLRQIVGGPKNRYKEEGYNLDLTYITDRVIGMAFPASGFEKLYRNSIDDVMRLFVENYGNSYLIINLSGRQIDEEKLPNTLNFQWEDHQSPPIEILFQICDKMARFLFQNENGVVGVHCNHGKGRTGTIICCFLLYCRLFNDEKQAREYYARKRFEIEQGYGVTQPCQIKYIQYFMQILKKNVQLPKVIAINKVTFKGDDICQLLYFKLREFHHNKQIFSTRPDKPHATHEIVNHRKKRIYPKIQRFIAGDIKFQVKAPTSLSAQQIAIYPFNTAFMDPNESIELRAADLSPYTLAKSGYFDKDFIIKIEYKAICKCQVVTPFHLRCESCRKLLKDEQQKWKIIRQAIQRQSQYSQQQLQSLLWFEPNNEGVGEKVDTQ